MIRQLIPSDTHLGGITRLSDVVHTFTSQPNAAITPWARCAVRAFPLGVSVSGFYAWLHAIPDLQQRAEAEADLGGHIGRIFAARRRVYGSPRVHAELRREGRRHALRRVERLMRKMGLSASQGRRPLPQTTDSRHDQPITPNLLARNFAAEQPDQVWLADNHLYPD